MKPRRDELWLVDFGNPVGREQGGRRPALVVSADGWNEGNSGVVIVVPCTTTRRGLPTHVELDPEASGLDLVSYAKCEDVKSVAAERFVARLGDIPLDAAFRVRRVLEILLDI